MKSFVKPMGLAALAAGMMAGAAFADTLAITGDIAYRERIALPENAVATVSLIDVSLADAPSTTIGVDVIEPAGQVPIDFVIDFDADAVVEGHSYAIAARIEVDGDVWFINDTRISVDPLTQTEPVSVPLVNARSAEPAPQPEDGDATEVILPADLAGRGWLLTMLGDTPSAEGIETTLVFGESDSSLGGTGGCNSYGGSVTFEDDGRLSISDVFSTMMACEDRKMSQERAFFDALGATSSYRIESEALILLDSAGNAVATLEAHASE
ncbi:YbaY family lipoprotein [Pelagibacterium halotolerans]|uniref:Lipoprotein-related protein n=1 Tax=Pelagibacterium halotolerans (strain DSM 22347 / JCM 15775 / CGMCC 1.7692 / B2) TaxID=1082931 RepID=G4RA35_PELHB|nr:YbaY family lipoprotein [Pelagibacterium halotolerans]AEQ53518.1 lipoprotein-related protein [Pelagibacterium halotolerans B2]QJR20305.1 META domain-containing protein [Pelagibacterium halotolerans]SEA58392.1 putative lipoprotein [Pelagibacterium halotolerans]